MYTTLNDALAALKTITDAGTPTGAQLDSFLKQVSMFEEGQISYPAGKVTVFFSGADSTIRNAIGANPDARIIGNTVLAKLLDESAFVKAKASSMGITDWESFNIRGTPLSDAFNEMGGEWDKASLRFASETVGDVFSLTGSAPYDRIWAQTELPKLLSRPEVTSIEGIPRATLLQLQSDLIRAGKTPVQAFDILRAKVSLQSDINLRAADVVIDANGKIAWIDVEKFSNGDLRNSLRPTGIGYTNSTGAERLNSNSNFVENNRLVQGNFDIVVKAVETLRDQPLTGSVSERVAQVAA